MEGEVYERKDAAPSVSTLSSQLLVAVQCGHCNGEDAQVSLLLCMYFRAVSIFKLPNVLALAVLFGLYLC